MKLNMTQVAEFCGVAYATVRKWVKRGLLRACLAPEHKKPRFFLRDVVKFLRECRMPLGEVEDEATAKVLLVANDQILVENIRHELYLGGPFKVVVADNIFDAGLQIGTLFLDCVIIDSSIGHEGTRRICQGLRAHPGFEDMIIVALLPEGDGSALSFDRSGINETIRKPLDPAVLKERLLRLIGARKKLI